MSRLPEDIQEALLQRDPHGHPPLSQIKTDELVIDLVSDKLRLLKSNSGSSCLTVKTMYKEIYSRH